MEISIRAQTDCIYTILFFSSFKFFSRFLPSFIFFSIFCRTTPDSFGSLRHIKRRQQKEKKKKISSTVLLLFLNPLALSITCWVRECETSFSNFRIFYRSFFFLLIYLLSNKRWWKSNMFFEQNEKCWRWKKFKLRKKKY